MNKTTKPGKSPDALIQMLAEYSPAIQQLFMKARARIGELIPNGAEEIDTKARLLGYTFMPGTYKGAILALTPAKQHVSIIFGHGVELMKVDPTVLLEGTGKSARHIKLKTEAGLDDPHVRELILAAAALTASKIGMNSDRST